MEISRAVLLQQRGVTVLSDVYSQASICGLRSSQMEANRHKALERLGIGKAPRWVRAFLDGWWRCRIDLGYRQDLVYGAFMGGRFVSTHRERPDYYEKLGISAREFAEEKCPTVGHYWSTTREPKPFFISAEDYRPLVGDATDAQVAAATQTLREEQGQAFAESQAEAAIVEAKAGM